MKNRLSVICLALFCMGTTSDATQLATDDLSDVEASLEDHEVRTEALRRLTSNAGDDLSPAPTQEKDSDASKPSKRRAEVREGQKSFARMLTGAKENTHENRSVRLARLVEAIGAGAQTIDVLAAFVDEYPAYRDARLALARVQLMHAAPAKSIVTLRPLTTALMQSENPDWQAWFWRGSARLAMDELEAARQDLEIALAKARDQVAIWVQLAVVEQELGNHTAAIQYLDIAQQLDPTSGQVYLNRAYSLEHLGDFESAQSAYRAFLVAEVQHPSRQMRAEVARRIGDLAAYDLAGGEIGIDGYQDQAR